MKRIVLLVDESNIAPEHYLLAGAALVRQEVLTGLRVAGKYFTLHTAPRILADLPAQVRVEKGAEVRIGGGLAGYVALLTEPPVVYGRQVGAMRPLYQGTAPAEILALLAVMARAATLLRLVEQAGDKNPVRIDAQAGTATVGAVAIEVAADQPLQVTLTVPDDEPVQTIRSMAWSVGSILREELPPRPPLEDESEEDR